MREKMEIVACEMREKTVAWNSNRQISVLIEGDTLQQPPRFKRLKAEMKVGSLAEFKAAVAKVVKIHIDEFDVEVLDTVFGDWCEPVDFKSLGETVKARLVGKQHDADEDEDTTFVIDPSSFKKFQATTYVFFAGLFSCPLDTLDFPPPSDSQLFIVLVPFLGAFSRMGATPISKAALVSIFGLRI
jgi:hypothetical protein